MNSAGARPRYVDRPWRRWLIAIGAAVGVHALVIWLAWPAFADWQGAMAARAVQRGPLTPQQVQRAIDETPLFVGLIGSGPTTGDLISGEDYASPAWARPPLALDQAHLPHAPQAWETFAPPFPRLSMEPLPPLSDR